MPAGGNRTADVRTYPTFELDATDGATAAAFSPDGSVLYIATTGEEVVATNSCGFEEPKWSTAVPDSDLCGMALSPEGMSVNTLCRLYAKQPAVNTHFSEEGCVMCGTD